jgi:hypothetical protein
VAEALYKDKAVSAALAKNMATEIPASDHANQEAARGLILPTPRLDPVLSPLLSQHHSTGRPSPKRYGRRYEIEES